jgi:hypothetical protein
MMSRRILCSTKNERGDRGKSPFMSVHVHERTYIDSFLCLFRPQTPDDRHSIESLEDSYFLAALNLWTFGFGIFYVDIIAYLPRAFCRPGDITRKSQFFWQDSWQSKAVNHVSRTSQSFRASFRVCDRTIDSQRFEVYSR